MNVYLYLLDTLADWEIGYLTAELNSRRFFTKDAPEITFIKVGSSLESIKTMGGISITPDVCISDVEFSRGDLLILPGGDTWFEECNMNTIDFVSGALANGTTVAAICNATVALAKKGLLDDRTHTSHDKEFLKMLCPEYTGEDHYVNKPAVSGENLITANGIAPLEFAYEVFKKIEVMKDKTLEAWYKLNKTQDGKYFFELMESMKE